MFEIIALMNPIQLKESSVNDAIDTPNREVKNTQSIEYTRELNIAYSGLTNRSRPQYNMEFQVGNIVFYFPAMK